MSLENAILEHAAALREVAASISLLASGGQFQLGVNARQAESAPANPAREAIQSALEATKASSKVKGTTKEEAAADTIPGKKDRDAEVKPDAELDQAVAKVEADAKKPAGGAAQTDTSVGAGSATEPALSDEPLNYDKDVKPALLKVAKEKGQPALVALLKSFGAARGTDLKTEQLPAVLAAAAKA